MAEIHVRAKRPSANLTWVWVLAGLLIIAAIIYYVLTKNKNQEPPPAAQPTSQSKLKSGTKPQTNKVKIVPVVYMRTV